MREGNPMPEKNGIFISYSHKDKQWLDRLKASLQPLVFGEIITVWDDRSIPAGSNWLDEINKAVASARIAVLLVSIDFLASGFIHRKELPDLLKRRDEGMGFFWVPIEKTLYKFTPLKDVQSAWDSDKPLSGLSDAELASALTDIATKLAEWKPQQ